MQTHAASISENGPAISVKGLHKKFASLEALSGISFDVRRGEIFGLLGPDGAGKTTIMRILAGLMDFDGGTVNVAGYDLKTEQPGLSDLIAYMPQRFGLYEDLTVMENILFYADLYDMKRGAGLDSRIEELLDFCRMTPFKNRLAGRLSGGMKQKLGLT
ncbi:MAG TPA: ABC transporter ATP-binding protein, partial [Candidatus Wallbacteria bacterium]|nr:ABC transporter ATP-binding protein [Candidatus Wallbacteria bacterium]